MCRHIYTHVCIAISQRKRCRGGDEGEKKKKKIRVRCAPSSYFVRYFVSGPGHQFYFCREVRISHDCYSEDICPTDLLCTRARYPVCANNGTAVIFSLPPSPPLPYYYCIIFYHSDGDRFDREKKKKTAAEKRAIK